MRRLGIVILLAATVAVFGWIMVASGLNDDNRTWVSAYKLITHLGLATALFAYLFWTWLKAYQPNPVVPNKRMYMIGWWIAGLLMVQILFGGLMAGMRAGLIHPHWPMFVQGSKLLDALSVFQSEGSGLINYEASLGVKAIVQVAHRLTAYVLSGFIIWYFVLCRSFNSREIVVGKLLLISLLVIQFILGILTIVYAIGRVPIGFGALHQCVALLLFISLLYLIYQFKQGYQQPQETDL